MAKPFFSGWIFDNCGSYQGAWLIISSKYKDTSLFYSFDRTQEMDYTQKKYAKQSQNYIRRGYEL